MTAFEQLVQDAKGYARDRGHNVQRLKHTSRVPGRAWGKCFRCGAELHVLEIPQPNEVQMGGEALSKDCGVRNGK